MNRKQSAVDKLLEQRVEDYNFTGGTTMSHTYLGKGKAPRTATEGTMHTPTSKQIINYLRANEDDIADSLGCSIGDLPPAFALHAAAPALLAALKKAEDTATELSCMAGMTPEGRRAVKIGERLHKLVTQAIANAEGR